MTTRLFLLLLGAIFFYQFSFAQKIPDSPASTQTEKSKLTTKNDSLAAADLLLKDSSKEKHSPRKAALRSAILPGWGQAYNKKYWKIPIVYGALGVTAYAFNFNLTQYKRVAYAYRLLLTQDTANYKFVDADLQPFLKANASNDLRNYRNEYRKDIDYSVLIFMFFWALNVVDATVDAHLKGFDVTDDLSLKIKPGFNPGTNTTGLSFVFDIHKAKPKLSGFVP
ncbi:MAG: DUF5683 domain-containing protein [Chitinophagaceae bacterium]